jgi:hypothetical protein
MSLLRASGSLTWFQPLVIDNNPNHDAQKEKRDISKLGQLWKYHGQLYGRHEPQHQEQKRFFAGSSQTNS